MKVTIAGMGLVSPLGIGRSLPFVPKPCGVGGVVDFDAIREAFPARSIAFLNPATVLALRAASEAVEDARHGAELPPPTGLVVGTCRPHHGSIARQFEEFRAKNEIRLIRGLNGGINAVAARLAIRFRARAFSYTVPSDSAAGLDAVLEGARMIQRGRAATVLAGGVDMVPAAGQEEIGAAAFMVLEAHPGGTGRRPRGLLLGWAGCGAPPTEGELRGRCGAAMIRRALAMADRRIDRILLSGGMGEERAVVAAVPDAGRLLNRLLLPSLPLGAPLGAFLLASALSSDSSSACEATLVVNFAPGKLLAAVIARDKHESIAVRTVAETNAGAKEQT